jgi:hypothetical protein
MTLNKNSLGKLPTEAQEQTTLFQWAGMMAGKWPELRLLHHVPNGGGRNPIEARHLKEQGVKSGIPDIFLPCARGGWHGLYIEMKRRKGGRVSIEQKKMILALRNQDYCVEVCQGWEEARDIITAYMEAGV